MQQFVHKLTATPRCRPNTCRTERRRYNPPIWRLVIQQHSFTLRLPNGLEVQIEGDKDFVVEGYKDIKAAAVAVFNREASHGPQAAARGLITSGEDALAHARALPPAPTTDAQAQGTEPRLQQRGQMETKPKRKNRKPSSADGLGASEARTARQAEIERIIKATSFKDDARYTGALRAAENALDRAALVSVLAKDEFAIDGGLSPSEVKHILERRFSIGQNSRKLEEAMAGAPTNFFVVGPAPFHGKMKLYRPMLGCIDRVKQLLLDQAAQPISATSGNAQPQPVVA